MSWKIILDQDTTVLSDDFTADDLIRIEKETGEPWGFLMPLREIKVAKAYLRTALRHVGRDPAEIDSWTLKQYKRAFDWIPEEEWPPSKDGEAESEDDAGPLDPGSSSGEPAASTGRPKRRAPKE